MRALVEAGADVNARDLGDMEGEVTALFVARDVRVTEYLLAHGADVNRRPRSGMTALMLATWEQDLARVEVLVKYGADLSLRDRRGKTAMDYAREKGGDEVIERLRARGAKRSSELH